MRWNDLSVLWNRERGCKKQIDFAPGKVMDHSKSDAEKVEGENVLFSRALTVGLHHFERHGPRAEKCQIDGGFLFVPETSGVA
jgi:hypothetical protein